MLTTTTTIPTLPTSTLASGDVSTNTSIVAGESVGDIGGLEGENLGLGLGGFISHNPYSYSYSYINQSFIPGFIMKNEKNIFYGCRRRYLHDDPEAYTYEPPIDFMTRFQSRKLYANKTASEEVANSKSVKAIAQSIQETNENINGGNKNLTITGGHKSPPNSPLKSARSLSHSQRNLKRNKKGKDYWSVSQKGVRWLKRIDPDEDPKNWDLQKKNGIKYLENKVTGMIKQTTVYDHLMEEDHRVATGHPIYDRTELMELLEILELNDEIQAKKSKKQGKEQK